MTNASLVSASGRRPCGCAPDSLDLRTDETVRLSPRGHPCCVRADRGTLLVTQEGDGRDHVVGPGASFRSAARGLVVLWALSEARVTLGCDRRAAA